MIRFVVPAYNEEMNIGLLIDEIHDYCTAQRYDHEMIVVDDGSRDQTSAIVTQRSASRRCSVISYQPNKGVQEAFRVGLNKALSLSTDADVIVTLEADRTSDITLLPQFLAKLSAGYDLCVASYYTEGGKVEGTVWYRKVLSFGANTLIRALLGIRGVSTYSSFYRAYKPAVLRQVLKKYGDFYVEKGFACVVELLLRISRLGYKITEVPMVLRGEKRTGKSKMKVMHTIMGYLRMIRRNAFRAS